MTSWKSVVQGREGLSAPEWDLFPGPRQEGFQQPWFVGSLYLCGLWGPSVGRLPAVASGAARGNPNHACPLRGPLKQDRQASFGPFQTELLLGSEVFGIVRLKQIAKDQADLNHHCTLHYTHQPKRRTQKGLTGGHFEFMGTFLGVFGVYGWG